MKLRIAILVLMVCCTKPPSPLPKSLPVPINPSVLLDIPNCDPFRVVKKIDFCPGYFVEQKIPCVSCSRVAGCLAKTQAGQVYCVGTVGCELDKTCKDIR